jgi:hypothetical protein
VRIIDKWIFPSLPILTISPKSLLKFKKEYQIGLAHIVENLVTDKINIKVSQHRKVIRKHIRNVYYTGKILKKCDFSEFSQLLTVNGRYSRNRAIQQLLREQGISVNILEGTAPNRYSIVDAAQSMNAYQNRIAAHWNEYDVAKRNLDGAIYFLNKIKNVINKTDPWAALMTASALPTLPTKKICVFYTTTQIEFVANEETPDDGNFSNQEEALRETYSWLNLHGWHMVVRRHPRNINWNSMGEDDLLTTDSGLGDSTIIFGNSTIDSYALAEKADLIVHYGSSIGAELIFQGLKPVIAVGQTPWYRFDKSNHFLNRLSLNSIRPENIQKADPQSVLPWGLYTLNGGTQYKYAILSDDLKWTLSGNPIRIDFRSWLKASRGLALVRLSGGVSKS